MDFDAAKKLAEQSALVDLQGLYDGPASDVLEAEHFETKDCIMFFRNRAIYVPPERALSEFAYAFSKHNNEARCVPDYWDDRARLKEYLDLLSGYFSRELPP